MISELVTNSVRHAGLDASEPVQLSVSVEGDTVRVAVRDPGPGFKPPPAPSDPAHVGGWGLVLVEQLAERWGVEHDGEANVVWCELKAAMTFEAQTERVGRARRSSSSPATSTSPRRRAATAALEAALDGAGVLVADLRELDLHRLDRRARAAHRRPAAREAGHALRRRARRRHGAPRCFEVTRIDQRFPVVDDPAELTGDDASPPGPAQ